MPLLDPVPGAPAPASAFVEQRSIAGSGGDAPCRGAALPSDRPDGAGAWSAPGLLGEDGLAAPAGLPLGGYPALAQRGVFTSEYPYSAVVFLHVVFPNGASAFGTGVMVGPNDVLTAAHVVYAPASGGYPTSLVAVPAYVPALGWEGSPFGFSTAAVTIADTGFDPDNDGIIRAGNGGPGLEGSERDVALLTLNTPLGFRTGWMDLDPTFKQGFAHLTGYPGVYGRTLTDDVALAYDAPNDSFTYITWFEAHRGNSGGPVWHYGPSGRPSVVGLVSSGDPNAGRGVAAFDIANSYDNILYWMASNDYLLA